MSFDGLPRGHYGAILADPPWHFSMWRPAMWNGEYRKDGTKIISPARAPQYETMQEAEILPLPVSDLAAPDCVLFMWACWPTIRQAFRIIDAWGFEFKTCGFCWIKADARQLELFHDEVEADMLLGYWTRSNSEICLLATRGQPKRTAADVRQAIIAPRREHSRKPDGIHERIERLVAGPYLELFARQRRPGWDCWGNEVDKFAPQQVSRETYDATDDFGKSIDEAYRAIRERKANGGKGWEPP